MSDDLQKHTLNLFTGDYEELQGHFPDLGAGPIIRRLVRAYLEKVRADGRADIDVDIEVKI